MGLRTPNIVISDRGWDAEHVQRVLSTQRFNAFQHNVEFIFGSNSWERRFGSGWTSFCDR